MAIVPPVPTTRQPDRSGTEAAPGRSRGTPANADAAPPAVAGTAAPQGGNDALGATLARSVAARAGAVTRGAVSGPLLQRTYHDEGTPGNRPALYQDDTGPAVSLLQKLLGMKPSGTFGPVTRKKVDAFQLKQGWKPSGVGPLTWQMLENPKGAKPRPKSSDFWTAYHVVDYDAMKQDDVWAFVGGSVGAYFDGGNTCATRISYGLNEGGWTIPTHDNSGSYHNDPKHRFNGKAGDNKKYIVRASSLQKWLTKLMGKPDATLKKAGEADVFESTLSPGQIAVFAGVHHAGVIKAGYKDPYVNGQGVLPVDVWKLS